MSEVCNPDTTNGLTSEELNNSNQDKKEKLDHYNPSIRQVNVQKLENGACGFNLSRSKWDPYPWVS